MPGPTIYPSTLGFQWGVASAETGFSCSSFRQAWKAKKFDQPNNVGETIGTVRYDTTAEITAEGEVMSGFTSVVGQKITLANVLTEGGPALGLVVCDGIELQSAREAMFKVTITATMYPLIPAT